MQDEQLYFIGAFGQICREQRHKRGWTLEDMIAHGFSAQHYQKIEAGKKKLTLWTAKRIADAFGMSLSDLLKDL